MGSVGIVSIVVGLFAGYMLLSAVFVARMPAFQTDAFRALPPEAQRKRLRRARIFGIFGATYLMLFLVGLNVVQRWTLAREAHPASEEQYLRKMANDFNRELPRTVAPGVRMERVAVHPGLELAYTFTLVELTADKVDRARFA